MVAAIISFIVLFALVFIDSSGDAQINRWHFISKDLILVFIPVSLLLGIVLGMSVLDVLRYSAAYIMIRGAFFNPIYNLFSRQKWYFFGTTKIWDRLNRKLNQSPAMLQGGYIIIGTLFALTLLNFFKTFN